MSLASLDQYHELMLDRPHKLTDEEVGYGPAEGSEICARCLHFYYRAVDGLSTCEIFRSDETDEEGVRPTWKCSFFTTDGEEFPLLKGDKS